MLQLAPFSQNPRVAVLRCCGADIYAENVVFLTLDIRCSGAEQAITFAYILLDYAKESQSEFDELFIEKNKYGRYWVHFAVRPSDNRRKVSFLNG